MYQWKKRNRKKKTEKLRTLGLKVIVPVFPVLFALLLCLIAGMRETRKLAEQYTEDTAGLYVEQINRDIFQINNELIQVLGKGIINEIPDTLAAADEDYYSLLKDILEQNRLLKIRYREVQNFFVYAQEPDVLIGDEGTVFSQSQIEGFWRELRNFSRKAADTNSGVTTWDCLVTEGGTYIIGWYAKAGKVMGCVMNAETIFSLLKEMTQRYEVVPFMEKKDGEVLYPEKLENREKLEKMKENTNAGSYYEYQLGTVGKICLYVLPDGGILETVLEMQTVLVVLISVLFVLCILFVVRYYQHLMAPLKTFVEGISNMEEEQMLNEDGKNNILELEAVSDRFRGLLRKIQSLKIAIYEKELNEKKAELEYMQEQIRPHFFLNCLSLIHGMADKSGEKDIVYITKVLSEYIRYNYQEAGKERRLQDEIEHVKKYMEIQKLRYGEEAFRFEVIQEEVGEEVTIPALVLQTLVENAVVHGVNLDHLVEISLYVTMENYNGEKYLYVCVSDTGRGFSEEVLKALVADTPIVYGGRKHIGLQNVRRRLELLYGQKAELSVQNMGEHCGAVVEVRILQSK
ncbi:MAG TPA: histidine kinase [Candidatus Blautia stercoravium]|nr:histidine kinase [Candidatus Blautia stercoravium]